MTKLIIRGSSFLRRYHEMWRRIVWCKFIYTPEENTASIFKEEE